MDRLNYKNMMAMKARLEAEKAAEAAGAQPALPLPPPQQANPQARPASKKRVATAGRQDKGKRVAAEGETQRPPKQARVEVSPTEPSAYPSPPTGVARRGLRDFYPTGSSLHLSFWKQGFVPPPLYVPEGISAEVQEAMTEAPTDALVAEFEALGRRLFQVGGHLWGRIPEMGQASYDALKARAEQAEKAEEEIRLAMLTVCSEKDQLLEKAKKLEEQNISLTTENFRLAQDVQSANGHVELMKDRIRAGEEEVQKLRYEVEQLRSKVQQFPNQMKILERDVRLELLEGAAVGHDAGFKLAIRQAQFLFNLDDVSGFNPKMDIYQGRLVPETEIPDDYEPGVPATPTEGEALGSADPIAQEEETEINQEDN